MGEYSCRGRSMCEPGSRYVDVTSLQRTMALMGVHLTQDEILDNLGHAASADTSPGGLQIDRALFEVTGRRWQRWWIGE